MEVKIMKDTKRDVEFLCLTVEMSGKTYSQDLNEDLRINSSDINESYIDQPSKFAWWAVLAAQARAKADRIKSAIEKQDEYIRKILTGELDAEVRKNLELDGEKVTEGKVTNGIYQHERYIEEMDKLHNLRDEYVEANEDACILEAAKDALNQRKEMLISLGAQMRIDMSNTELTMKKKVADIISSKRNGGEE